MYVWRITKCLRFPPLGGAYSSSFSCVFGFFYPLCLRILPFTAPFFGVFQLLSAVTNLGAAGPLFDFTRSYPLD